MGTPPPIYLDTISMPDTLILMVLALVVFGPRRLPQLGKQLGKLMYEFRKASNDFKFQMEEELRQAEEADRRKKQEEERQRTLAGAPPAPQIEAAKAPLATTTPPAESPIKQTGSETAAQPAEEDPYANLASPESAAYYAARAATEPAAPAAQGEPVTPPADLAESALPAQPAEPRILPPSIGETVAADRPGAQPQQELFASPSDATGKLPETVAPETERSEPATQPAAHHG